VIEKLESSLLNLDLEIKKSVQKNWIMNAIRLFRIHPPSRKNNR